MKPCILHTSRLSFSLASAIAALLSLDSASAQNGTWTGISGNWSDTTNPGGVWTGGIFADGSGFTANFTSVDIAANQAITLDANRTIGNITFTDATTSSHNLLISGGNILTLDVTSGTPTINVTQSGRTLTIDSVIGGTEGLQKTGAGGLTLNGPLASNFTGGLNVSGGTLALDFTNLAPPTNLIDPANALSFGGGTVTLIGQNLAAATTSQTFASTTLGVGFNRVNISKGASATSATLNLGALTVSPGSATTIITGTAGSTTWTNSTIPTFEIIKVSSITGKTLPVAPGTANWINVNAGLFYRQSTSANSARWVNVNNLGNLLPIPASLADQGTSGTVTVGRSIGGASITLVGSASSYGLLANSTSPNNRTLDLGGFTYTINGILGIGSGKTTISPGTGGTVVVGDERNLVINLDNTGGVDINAPIVDNGTGASGVTIVSTIPSGTPGTVLFGGANTYTGATLITASTLSLTSSITGGGAISTSGTGILTQSAAGVISGASTFTHGSSGTSTLAGANTYTGATLINVGTLSLTGSITGGGAISTSGTGILTQSAAGVISGASTFTQGSSGTSTLAGANTYTAATTINTGILAVSNATALGTTAGNTTIAANGTTTTGGRLSLSGGITSAENITITGGGETSAFGAAISNTSGNNTLSGDITLSNPTSGIRLGAAGGSMTFSGNITQTGTTPRGLVLQASIATSELIINNPIANIGGGLSVFGGGSVGGTVTLKGVSGTGIGSTLINQTATLKLGVTNALNTSGNLTIANAGTSTDTFDLAGFNQTVNGLSSQTGGNRRVTNSVASTASTLTVGNGGGSATFNGIIQDGVGTVALTKTGAGTQTLTGSNIYTGATTVQAGALIVTSTGSTATGSAVTVNGGDLGGTGTVGGNVTVAAAGNLAPGVTAGTLNITGNLDISAMASGTGKLKFGLDALAGTNDQIVVSGTLALGTLSLDDLALTNLGGLQAGTYTLITSTGLTGTVDGSTALIATGFNGKLQITGNNLELVVTTATTGSAYDTWKTVNAPSGTPSDDFDGDGVSNAVEFVLGGLATTRDLDRVPVVATSGGNMTFVFKRAQSSIDPKTSTFIEVGTDLATWNIAPSPYTVPDGAVASNPSVAVVKDSPSVGTDTITLTVPQTPDASKFARLKVLITP